MRGVSLKISENAWGKLFHYIYNVILGAGVDHLTCQLTLLCKASLLSPLLTCKSVQCLIIPRCPQQRIQLHYQPPQRGWWHVLWLSGIVSFRVTTYAFVHTLNGTQWSMAFERAVSAHISCIWYAPFLTLSFLSFLKWLSCCEFILLFTLFYLCPCKRAQKKFMKWLSIKCYSNQCVLFLMHSMTQLLKSRWTSKNNNGYVFRSQ